MRGVLRKEQLNLKVIVIGRSKVQTESILCIFLIFSDDLDGVDQSKMLMNGDPSSRTIVPVYFDTHFPQIQGTAALM